MSTSFFIWDLFFISTNPTPLQELLEHAIWSSLPTDFYESLLVTESSFDKPASYWWFGHQNSPEIQTMTHIRDLEISSARTSTTFLPQIISCDPKLVSMTYFSAGKQKERLRVPGT